MASPCQRNTPGAQPHAREQRQLEWRLRSVMFGGGTLAIGLCWGRWLPEQDQVAGLALTLGVLLLSWHIFLEAAKGFLKRDPNTYGDQLVALAILAAFVSGDLVSAGMVALLMEIGHILEVGASARSTTGPTGSALRCSPAWA